MNLSELIDAFRVDERDKAKPPNWSDDQLIRWFNEAVEEAAIRKSLLRETLSLSLIPGDFEIALPARVVEVRTARIVEGGRTYWLDPTDRYEQDRLNRDWRDIQGRPTAIILDDASITLNRIVSSSATLKLECFRVPRAPMEDGADEPEIAVVHHRRLEGWVRFRAYSDPDGDFGNPDKATQGLADFESYFGRRPDAIHQRDVNSNRPHRVKVCL
ncbi:MAG TPA: hypothetical protein PKK30_16655 [Nitrospira sp.]|nr:hypothetical protein [Nitrospira sp.]